MTLLLINVILAGLPFKQLLCSSLVHCLLISVLRFLDYYKFPWTRPAFNGPLEDLHAYVIVHILILDCATTKKPLAGKLECL